MRETILKSRATVCVAAIMAVIVAAAIGLMAPSQPAYAASYKVGTPVANVKTTSPAKSKVAGTWKLLKSTDSDTNAIIKNNKRINPKAKCTITFKKNGKVVIHDYTGTTIKNYKWVAVSKKAGYMTVAGLVFASAQVKGKTMKLKFPKTNSTKAFTWTMKKI